jgi:hypothetical protein
MGVSAISLLENGYDSILSNATSLVNNATTAQIIGGAVGSSLIVGGALGAVLTRKKRKKPKKKTKKSKKKTSRKKKKLKFGSKAYRKKYLGKHKRRKQKKPYTAGKRKDTSHKRIRYTKNNQPYVILSNGRARFVKRSSVRRSKKMKGGRY